MQLVGFHLGFRRRIPEQVVLRRLDRRRPPVTGHGDIRRSSSWFNYSFVTSFADAFTVLASVARTWLPTVTEEIPVRSPDSIRTIVEPVNELVGHDPAPSPSPMAHLHERGQTLHQISRRLATSVAHEENVSPEPNRLLRRRC